MRDRITANLPSRSFDLTAAFYRALGFRVVHRDAAWMGMDRDGMELEFFPHPGLDPARSWFSACAWVADLDALHRAWRASALPAEGIPRMTAPAEIAPGLRMFALVDLDGSLLRCLEPHRAA